MADGSIIFDTRIDNAGAMKDLKRLNTRIKTLTQQIETKSALRAPIAAQAKQMAAQLDAAKSSLEAMKASSGAFTSDQISAQAETVNALQAEWNKTQSKVESYDKSIKKAQSEMDVLKEQAGEIEAEMASAGVNTEKMAKATKRASKGAMGFARQIKFAMSSILIYGTLFQVFSKLTEWVGKVIRVNDEAADSVGRLKGALLTLVQPIIGVIIPAITFLANALARVISVISAFVSALFGSTAKESAEAAEGLYNEAAALDSVGSSAKSASKQLASFDEINKISSEESGGDAGGTGIIPADFSGLGDLNWLEETLGKAAGWVAAALLIGGIALVAIGAANANLSLVLAGLLMLGSSVVVGEETGVFADWAAALGLESAEQFVPLALMVGGIALIAIGAALGQILMVIAGLGLIGSAVLVSEKNETLDFWAEKLGLESVFDYVDAALQLAGVALIAIGAAMGNIFMVIAGAALLSAGIAADVIGEETLKSWWETLKLTSVQQWVGVALILGGIALIVIGAAMANILMILAGFAILAVGTITSASEGNLKDWVTVLGLEKAVGWVTAGLLVGGIALVIFGILTANIFMVIAGLGLLGSGIAIGVTSGTFSSWLNTIANAFSAFASTIGNIFNSLWNTIKSVINWILGGIEGMANGVINGINFMIKALNKVKFKVPDWVPGIGGNNFGFNIPTISNVSIPRLAQGAVIPPNQEFLAVLGDQKSGTNVEAPLETIKQALIEAMQSVGYGTGGTTTVVVNLDGKEVARNTVRHVNEMTRQSGKPVLLY